MSVEELSEGEPIVPQGRQLWRDATRWKILNVSEEEEDPCVTFQAGTYLSNNGIEMPITFRCAKSGMIYREWEKERIRREAGGAPPEVLPPEIVRVETIFQRGPEPKEEVPRVVRLVDSQLEERQHRLNEMRRKFHLLNWGDEKDRLLSEIVALEKKLLGDP